MMESFMENPNARPSDLMREKELPDGTRVREVGPVVYGYSMTLDEKGQPIVRQFGNVNTDSNGRPTLHKGLPDTREPLVDVINGGDTVRVVVELAGVSKDEIEIYADPDGSVLIETTGNRKYSKKLQLPAMIDSESATSTYNNGILEVVFRKKASPKSSGKRIRVE